MRALRTSLVDERDVAMAMQDIRQRSAAMTMRPRTSNSSKTAPPTRKQPELYSLDSGDPIPAYQVEINTDGAGDREIDDTYDYLMGFGRGQSFSSKNISKENKKQPRPKPVIPRYTYSESLHMEIVEHYDMVKYLEDEQSRSGAKMDANHNIMKHSSSVPNAAPTIQKRQSSLRRNASASPAPKGSPTNSARVRFEEEVLLQPMQVTPSPSRTTTKDHHPPRVPSTSNSAPARCRTRSDPTVTSVTTATTRSSRGSYFDDTIDGTTITANSIVSTNVTVKPMGPFCLAGLPWFNRQTGKENNGSTGLSKIREKLPRSLGSLQSGGENDYRNFYSKSQFSSDDQSAAWYTYTRTEQQGLTSGAVVPPTHRRSSSGDRRSSESGEDSYDDDDDDFGSEFYTVLDENTTAYYDSSTVVAQPKGIIGSCIPVLEGVIQGLEDAERMVMGDDDDLLYDDDDLTEIDSMIESTTTSQAGQKFSFRGASFCAVRKTPSGKSRFFKA